MTGLTYAVADLHGRFDLFEIAVGRIRAHAQGAAATLVTLGDYVDRGPASRQLIDTLMQWDRADDASLRLVALKGNHEAMMWEACSGFLEPARWLRVGGNATLASYGAGSADVRRAVPQDHLAWLSALPLLHVDQHRVFAHAAVDPTLALAHQNALTVLWKRYPPGFKKGHGRLHLVHGHDGTAAAPVVTSGKTNLDSLAWKTGRLVVGIYDDERPGPAVDYIEIAGSPAA